MATTRQIDLAFVKRFQRDHAVTVPTLPKAITEMAVRRGRAWICRVPFDHPRSNVRKKLYQMGVHLKREMGYDFPPYSAEHQSAHDCAYVFAVEPDVDIFFAVGGCAFHWVEWTNAKPCFSMRWVWSHPLFRHRGYFSAAWPYFRELYGDFVVEPPHSAAMTVFLSRVGYVQPPADGPRDGGTMAPS